MPFDPVSAAVMVGSALYGGYRQYKDAEQNRQAQSELNQQTIQFNWDMYNQQRKDALSDWSMVNQYNSPEQQMARLRQAGLNPNLIYGKGAEFTAQQIRGSQGGNVNLKAPIKDSTGLAQGASTAAQAYLNARMQQAQTDNLHQQNQLLIKEGVYKDAQTANMLIKTAKDKFDYEQALALKDLTIEAARQNVLNTIASTNNLNANTQRTLALTPEEVKKLQTEVKQMESNIAVNSWQMKKIANDITMSLEANKRAEDLQPIQKRFLTEQVNKLMREQDMQPLTEQEVMARINDLKAATAIKDLDAQMKQLDLYDKQWEKGNKALLLLRRLLDIFK